MTPEEIKQLAHLARIDVTDAEVAEYAADFDAILNYVDQISSVDVSGIEAPILQKNIARTDDHAHPSNQFAPEMIADAPASHDGFYKVPKIL